MSLRLRIFSLLTRISFKSVLKYSQNVTFIRKHVVRISGTSFRQVKGAVFTKMALGANNSEVPVLKVEIGNTVSDGAMLYIHGGGFIFGSPHVYRHFGADFSNRLHIPVYLAQYRLAPEHPFPQGLHDVKTCYHALIDQGIPSDKIVVGGDSAGGNLALGLLRYLIEQDLPLPACSFVISPVTDFTFASPSLQKNAFKDAVLAANQSDFLRGLYLGDQDPSHPDASPIFGDFKGLTPILFHASSKEILRDDTLRMTELLAKQKVDVRTKFWRNNYHVFHLLRGRVPEADQAIGEIVQFILKHLKPAPNDS